MKGWRVFTPLAAARRRLQILSAQFTVLLWLAVAPAAGQMQHADPASPCTSCHTTQASELLTPMGKALELPVADSVLSSRPNLTVRKGAYTYGVETSGGKSVYRVTDGVDSITMQIRWTFGEGAQTWLLDRDGQFYESMVSYYPSIKALDITTGDEVLKPKTLEEAIGRKLVKGEVTACFGCHATNAVSNGELNLQTLEPGVRCAHCHTGSESHFISEAISSGDTQSAPPDLAKLSSEAVSNFCGQCHRTWELVVRSGWRGRSNARFQPYRLANSKCFDGTDHRISCLACHDPHQTVVRDDFFYDSKCLACHTDSHSHAAEPPPAGAKVCPVAKSKCVSCHMPKVKLPNGLMTFYDHQIRIVKPGEPYPN